MRLLLSFLLLAHGVAHLPGFLVAWGLMSFPERPYRTTVFGTVDVGAAGARLVGFGWLVTSVVFVALAGALAFRINPPLVVLPVALGFSAMLCVAGWPEALYGFVANSAIAAMLVAGERYGLI
jgi:hypothetical protein